VCHQGQGLITDVDGARDPIIDLRGLSILAALHRVTELRPIAEDPVVTFGVLRDVGDHVVFLIAVVGGALDPIVHHRRLSLLAVICEVTELDAITEEVVVAQIVVDGVGDLVHVFVTVVHGASHPVVQHRNICGLAA